MPRRTLSATVMALAGALMVSSAAFAPVASADCPADDFDKRKARVEQRIQYGLETGKLTRQEADRYRKKLDKLARKAMKCRTDGKGMSAWEINELVGELSDLSWKVSRRLKNPA